MITIRRWIALSIVCAAAPATIFLASAPAAARHRSVEVGPIWNQMDANRKCPEAARRAGGTWTGQWRTTRPGQMSECDIRVDDHDRMRMAIGPAWMEHGHHHQVRSIEVGPIWNQMDADRKCREAAQRAGGTWTGQWRTTRPGQMSECDIRR